MDLLNTEQCRSAVGCAARSTLHCSRITTKENDITTVADDNAATVRRGYEAFNSADMKTLTEIFDERAS
jgi:hypothetical protein